MIIIFVISSYGKDSWERYKFKFVIIFLYLLPTGFNNNSLSGNYPGGRGDHVPNHHTLLPIYGAS